MAERHPEDAAREFLRGLQTRKKQPWDDIGKGAGGEEPSRDATPSPLPPKPAAQPADEVMSQAERIAARNRDLAKRTRYLRKD